MKKKTKKHKKMARKQLPDVPVDDDEFESPDKGMWTKGIPDDINENKRQQILTCQLGKYAKGGQQPD